MDGAGGTPVTGAVGTGAAGIGVVTGIIADTTATAADMETVDTVPGTATVVADTVTMDTAVGPAIAADMAAPAYTRAALVAGSPTRVESGPATDSVTAQRALSRVAATADSVAGVTTVYALVAALAVAAVQQAALVAAQAVVALAEAASVVADSAVEPVVEVASVAVAVAVDLAVADSTAAVVEADSTVVEAAASMAAVVDIANRGNSAKSPSASAGGLSFCFGFCRYEDLPRTSSANRSAMCSAAAGCA